MTPMYCSHVWGTERLRGASMGVTVEEPDMDEVVLGGERTDVVANAAAFERFFEREWDGVYRPLAVTLGDPELARDATAEAMARAFEHWSRVQHYRNPAGWVHRVGLNWARSRFRHTRREVLGGKAEPTSPHWEPSDPAMSNALKRLPIKFRSVVVLRYLADWSQEQIADALGIPVGTVKSRVHRALSLLRKEMTL